MYAALDPRMTLINLLPKDGIGAEIGVFKGNFSDSLLNIARPKLLHLVDPWISSNSADHKHALYGQAQRSQADMDAMCAEVRARFAKKIEAGQVVIHREMSKPALEKLPDDSLDWVYIDGDHNEAGVATDLDVAFRKVKRSGLICGDDYTFGGWWRAGVVRATNKFIGDHFDQISIVFVIDTQFVLRKLPPTG